LFGKTFFKDWKLTKMGNALSLIFSLIADAVKAAIRDSIPPLKRPRADKQKAIDKAVDRELAKK